MGTAIAQYEHSETTLSQWRKPEEVLNEARLAAVALKTILEQKTNKVMFNKEQYLEFEDWQTVAKFYGCTVKILSTNFVQFGDVRGWEATAAVLDRNQSVISQAESMCLSDEENWGSVPKYEWKDVLDEHGKKIWIEGPNGKKRPKAERVHVGDVQKPLFQLRSMAQTRAGARAFRQVFAWVVVLAGYKPSVAEEMTGNEHPSDDRGDYSGEQGDPNPRQQVQQPQRASEVVIEEIKGEIRTVKPGAEDKGGLWLSVDAKNVRVNPDQMHDEMKVGAYLVAKAKKVITPSLVTVWMVTEVVECSPVQDGEAVESSQPEPTETGEKSYFTPESVQKPVEQSPILKDLVASGAVKPASQIKEPEPTKPGTIGAKRASRLHAIVSQNEKTTGFTHATLEEFKASVGIEHLRDLPVELYPEFEEYADGTKPYRKGK